jgi:hypothetical protein
MKSKILVFFAFVVVAGFSSCLKSYTCECEKTYYTNYLVDSVQKSTAQFNGSRKSPVIEDCDNLEDSVKNAQGNGWVTYCDIK